MNFTDAGNRRDPMTLLRKRTILRSNKMDNPGIYLWLWILIAPLVGVVILSNLGSSRTDRKL